MRRITKKRLSGSRSRSLRNSRKRLNRSKSIYRKKTMKGGNKTQSKRVVYKRIRRNRQNRQKKFKKNRNYRGGAVTASSAKMAAYNSYYAKPGVFKDVKTIIRERIAENKRIRALHDIKNAVLSFDRDELKVLLSDRNNLKNIYLNLDNRSNSYVSTEPTLKTLQLNAIKQITDKDKKTLLILFIKACVNEVNTFNQQISVINENNLRKMINMLYYLLNILDIDIENYSDKRSENTTSYINISDNTDKSAIDYLEGMTNVNIKMYLQKLLIGSDRDA